MGAPASAFAAEFFPLLQDAHREEFIAAIDQDPILVALAYHISVAEHDLLVATEELNRVLDVTNPSRHALRLADYDAAMAALASRQKSYRDHLLATFKERFPRLALTPA
jgi:hypothetical protein